MWRLVEKKHFVPPFDTLIQQSASFPRFGLCSTSITEIYNWRISAYFIYCKYLFIRGLCHRFLPPIYRQNSEPVTHASSIIMNLTKPHWTWLLVTDAGQTSFFSPSFYISSDLYYSRYEDRLNISYRENTIREEVLWQQLFLSLFLAVFPSTRYKRQKIFISLAGRRKWQISISIYTTL